MPRRKVYHPKRIKKTTRRALEKRNRPREVTKAEIRRLFNSLADRLRRDILRFQRSRNPVARKELLRKIVSNTDAALEINPRSHLLRDLGKEGRELLAGPVKDMGEADLTPFLAVSELGAGKVPKPHRHGPRP